MLVGLCSTINHCDSIAHKTVVLPAIKQMLLLSLLFGNPKVMMDKQAVGMKGIQEKKNRSLCQKPLTAEQFMNTVHTRA